MELNKVAFEDEMDVLQLESVSSSTSLQKKKATCAVLEGELSQKSSQMSNFRIRCDMIKERLEAEVKMTVSRGKTIEYVEQQLKEKQRDLNQTQNQIQTLKDKSFKDSQKLAASRQEESDLIADIRNTEVKTYSICHLSFC